MMRDIYKRYLVVIILITCSGCVYSGRVGIAATGGTNQDGTIEGTFTSEMGSTSSDETFGGAVTTSISGGKMFQTESATGSLVVGGSFFTFGSRNYQDGAYEVKDYGFRFGAGGGVRYYDENESHSFLMRVSGSFYGYFKETPVLELFLDYLPGQNVLMIGIGGFLQVGAIISRHGHF